MESVGDLGWGCDGACSGLDLDGGGDAVNDDKNGIVWKVVVCEVVGDELEVKSAGDEAVIGNVVGLVKEEVLDDQHGQDGREAEELEKVAVVQECV